MEKTCKHCNQTFDMDGRVFSNHVRWCDKNPKSRKYKNQVKSWGPKSTDKKLGKNKSFQVVCQKCGKKFEVIEREKQFPKRNVYFCGRSCANSRKHSEETKKKTSLSLLGNANNANNANKIKRDKRLCEYCNTAFEALPSAKKRFCSISCSRKSCKSSNEYLTYKQKCKFNFNVWDYPNDFKLELIYKHGWYQPVNRGNNIGGVSRDHKISVKFGWENDIDPELICHPANCELMVHRKNIAKNKKCSVALNQLKKDIKLWEQTH
jgi:hypothetical protein